VSRNSCLILFVQLCKKRHKIAVSGVATSVELQKFSWLQNFQSSNSWFSSRISPTVLQV